MTMVTLTLRHSGLPIKVDVEEVTQLQVRKWGTILHFMRYILEVDEHVTRWDQIEVQETYAEILQKDLEARVAEREQIKQSGGQHGDDGSDRTGTNQGDPGVVE